MGFEMLVYTVVAVVVAVCVAVYVAVTCGGSIDQRRQCVEAGVLSLAIGILAGGVWPLVVLSVPLMLIAMRRMK
jgi:hypothetical protein